MRGTMIAIKVALILGGAAIALATISLMTGVFSVLERLRSIRSALRASDSFMAVLRVC